MEIEYRYIRVKIQPDYIIEVEAKKMARPRRSMYESSKQFREETRKWRSLPFETFKMASDKDNTQIIVDLINRWCTGDLPYSLPEFLKIGAYGLQYEFIEIKDGLAHYKSKTDTLNLPE